MGKTVEAIRADLRTISKNGNYIKALTRSIDRYNQRLKYLSGDDSIPIKKSIEDIEKKLNIVIKQVSNSEQKYMSYILKLSNVSKYMLIDYYINNMPVWKIANKYNYSENHCRRLMYAALKKIANMAN